MTTTEKFEAARNAVLAAEVAGRSVRTLNRLWNLYFVAEDAMKSSAGGWR